MDESTLQSEYWAITPSALQQLVSYDFSKLESPVEPLANEGELSFKEREKAFMAQFDEQLQITADGVGILDVKGTLMPNPDIVDRFFFNAASHSRLTALVGAAAQSEEVKALVLNIDSPGGTVMGTPEFGQAVRDFNDTGKPSFAVADKSLMASAAYWVGSQASGVYATESAIPGSVGVLSAHVDLTEARKKDGVKVEVFKAGKFKAAGAMATALTEEQRDAKIAGLNEMHEEFKAVVTANRPIAAEHLEGQTFSGKRAAEIGMVDGVVSGLAEVIDMATYAVG